MQTPIFQFATLIHVLQWPPAGKSVKSCEMYMYCVFIAQTGKMGKQYEAANSLTGMAQEGVHFRQAMMMLYDLLRIRAITRHNFTIVLDFTLTSSRPMVSKF